MGLKIYLSLTLYKNFWLSKARVEKLPFIEVCPRAFINFNSFKLKHLSQ